MPGFHYKGIIIKVYKGTCSLIVDFSLLEPFSGGLGLIFMRLWRMEGPGEVASVLLRPVRSVEDSGDAEWGPDRRDPRDGRTLLPQGGREPATEVLPPSSTRTG